MNIPGKNLLGHFSLKCFLISVVLAVCYFAVLVVGGVVMGMTNVNDVDPLLNTPAGLVLMLVWALFCLIMWIGGFILSVIGMIYGAISLFQSDQKKAAALLGLCVNISVLVLFLYFAPRFLRS